MCLETTVECHLVLETLGPFTLVNRHLSIRTKRTNGHSGLDDTRPIELPRLKRVPVISAHIVQHENYCYIFLRQHY